MRARLPAAADFTRAAPSGGRRDEIAALIADACARTRSIRLLAEHLCRGILRRPLGCPRRAASASSRCAPAASSIAQGAYEQPAVFRGNDLPGVMLASAAQRLIYRHAVAPATRIAVLTANARRLRRRAGRAGARHRSGGGAGPAAGAAVRSSADGGQRARARGRRAAPRRCGRSRRAVAMRSCRRYCIRSRGELRGAATTLDRWLVDERRVRARQCAAASGRTRACAMSPALEQFVPNDAARRVSLACGKVNGVLRTARIAWPMAHAGAAAAARLGIRRYRARAARRSSARMPHSRLSDLSASGGKEFVDFDEDLQVKDIENACRKGLTAASCSSASRPSAWARARASIRT